MVRQPCTGFIKSFLVETAVVPVLGDRAVTAMFPAARDRLPQYMLAFRILGLWTGVRPCLAPPCDDRFSLLAPAQCSVIAAIFISFISGLTSSGQSRLPMMV